MTPSHACKGARRYRYYVTVPDLVTKGQPSWRLPAHDLETLVTRRMATLLGDAHAVQAAVAEVVELDGPEMSTMLDRASRIAGTASAGSAECVPLFERIDLCSDSVDMTIDLARLLKPSADGVVDDLRSIPLTISTPAARIRRGTEVRLVLVNPGDHDDDQIDPALVGLIVRAHAARTTVAEHPGRSLADTAAAQGVTTDYFTLLIRLSTLAPDIVTAILAGRQPASLNRQRLARTTNLPLEWGQQRALLGFV